MSNKYFIGDFDLLDILQNGIVKYVKTDSKTELREKLEEIQANSESEPEGEEINSTSPISSENETSGSLNDFVESDSSDEQILTITKKKKIEKKEEILSFKGDILQFLKNPFITYTFVYKKKDSTNGDFYEVVDIPEIKKKPLTKKEVTKSLKKLKYKNFNLKDNSPYINQFWVANFGRDAISIQENQINDMIRKKVQYHELFMFYEDISFFKNISMFAGYSKEIRIVMFSYEALIKLAEKEFLNFFFKIQPHFPFWAYKKDNIPDRLKSIIDAASIFWTLKTSNSYILRERKTGEWSSQVIEAFKMGEKFVSLYFDNFKKTNTIQLKENTKNFENLSEYLKHFELSLIRQEDDREISIMKSHASTFKQVDYILLSKSEQRIGFLKNFFNPERCKLLTTSNFKSYDTIIFDRAHEISESELLKKLSEIKNTTKAKKIYLCGSALMRKENKGCPFHSLFALSSVKFDITFEIIIQNEMILYDGRFIDCGDISELLEELKNYSLNRKINVFYKADVFNNHHIEFKNGEFEMLNVTKYYHNPFLFTRNTILSIVVWDTFTQLDLLNVINNCPSEKKSILFIKSLNKELFEAQESLSRSNLLNIKDETTMDSFSRLFIK